jgi:membrane protein YqaA with SNARE-associated domain
LHTITKLLSRYTAWLWSVLAPLGVWGVLGATFFDSAFLGLPIDAIVAGYVYTHRAEFWLYVLLASAGSALGSLVIYGIGYKGGELLLRKRVSARRMEELRVRFEQQEFIALMVPAMLPPPMPFKVFLLAAAVFRMRLRHYLLAIFLGRLVRFGILSALVLIFGPQVVVMVGAAMRDHPSLTLTIVALVILAGVLLYVATRGKKKTARAT